MNPFMLVNPYNSTKSHGYEVHDNIYDTYNERKKRKKKRREAVSKVTREQRPTRPKRVSFLLTFF